eukprot:CAMPEP_0201922168 /NCGR_PEP_ID=MMETSP0903-20130614/10276_1 /ASSEMBLY_ACC=CAM_ASM_000552 /TAXON_ID=420261 /ORGANISM="Thalassiosira antarctica, Strain CCMP982" /LENGTH=126 /DNA_ID=CAMNT_0048459251 /DNA_START=154 /DNA_END=530 /DNA_ORIENTATION=+
MIGGPVGPAGDKEKINGPTQTNTQLPQKQQQPPIKSMVNTMQQNQQNSNPQTAMSGQIQQANAASQIIQPISQQQQMTQQQQITSPHTNQHMNVSAAQTNQQNSMQQQQQDNSGQNLQQQHLQMPT